MRNLNELYEKYPFLFDKVKINEDGVFHALITVDAFHKRRANDFNLMYMSKEKLAELFNDIYFISGSIETNEINFYSEVLHEPRGEEISQKVNDWKKDRDAFLNSFETNDEGLPEYDLLYLYTEEEKTEYLNKWKDGTVTLDDWVKYRHINISEAINVTDKDFKEIAYRIVSKKKELLFEWAKRMVIIPNDPEAREHMKKNIESALNGDKRGIKKLKDYLKIPNTKKEVKAAIKAYEDIFRFKEKDYDPEIFVRMHPNRITPTAYAFMINEYLERLKPITGFDYKKLEDQSKSQIKYQTYSKNKLKDAYDLLIKEEIIKGEPDDFINAFAGTGEAMNSKIRFMPMNGETVHKEKLKSLLVTMTGVQSSIPLYTKAIDDIFTDAKGNSLAGTYLKNPPKGAPLGVEKQLKKILTGE